MNPLDPLLASGVAISDNEAYAAVLDEVLCNMKSTLLAEHARLLKIAQEMTLAECKSESAAEMASCNSSLDIGTQTAPMSATSEVRTRTETVMSQVITGAETVMSEMISGAETVTAGIGTRTETVMSQVISGAETVMSEMISGAETVTAGIGAMGRSISSAGSSDSTDLHAVSFAMAHRPALEINEDIHTRARLHLHFASEKARSRARRKGEYSMCHYLRRLCKFLKISSEHPLVAVDTFMAMVILVNGISIGVSCDTETWPGWVPINILFCILFLLEFLAKVSFLGCRDYFRGADKGWHWFEVVLLILSLCEVVVDIAHTGNTLRGISLFRTFRLIRLTKLFRIFRLPFLKDVIWMIHGAIGGLRTLFWSLVLISLPLYVVALVLRETLGKEAAVGDGFSDRETSGVQMFSTLAKSFFTVFRCVAASDCSDDFGRPIFVIVSEQYGWGYTVIYAFSVMLMTFGLFNIIIAIYVENTLSAAKFDDVRKKQLRIQDQEMFQEKSLELAMLAWSHTKGHDLSNLELHNMRGEIDLQALYDMELTEADFVKLVNYDVFSELLLELDIAREDQLNIFDILDVDQSGTIDVNELVKGIAKLRGDARKAEIVAVLLVVRHISQTLATVSGALEDQQKVLESLQAAASLAPAVVQLESAEASEKLSNDNGAAKGSNVVDLESSSEDKQAVLL